VGGHAFTATHLDHAMHVLGYAARDGRAILADKVCDAVVVVVVVVLERENELCDGLVGG
jgi:hypothetical protein